MIGGAHLFNGKKAGLTEDRFARPLSALSLNGGSYQIPPGNYFQNGQFSITTWIKLKNYGSYPGLVKFSNGFKNESIFLGFNMGTSKPQFIIFNGNQIERIANSISSSAIQLNIWTHLAMTFDQNFNNLIYVNANITASGNLNQPLKYTTRISNYIGRPDGNQPDLNGTIDELKIFNRALSQQEIQFEMNNI